MGTLKLTHAYVYRRAMKVFAEREALVTYDKSGRATHRLTYRQVDERSSRLANGLLSLGVDKGDRISSLLTNSHHGFECGLAISKIGAVNVPLNARDQNEEHAYKINHAGSRTLIYGKDYCRVLDAIKASIPDVRNFICVDDENPKYGHGYETLLAGSSCTDPMIEVSEDDLASIHFTGGTTGRAKGAMSTSSTQLHHMVSHLLSGFSPTQDDVMVHVGPITHASGGMFPMVFVRGGKNVILPEFDVELFLSVVQQERGTASFMVPTMIIFLLRHPNLRKYDFSSLRYILYGAAPMPIQPLEEIIEVFGPIFYQSWGQTETPMTCTLLQAEDHKPNGTEKDLKRLGSAGREMFLNQVRIVDAKGGELPRGEIGEVAVRGGHTTPGYWKDPDATAERYFPGGWWGTTDLGHMDEDGFVYITDRKNDMIISGGFNIYPKEVEDAIYSFPGVSMAAVVGVPDDQWGESVKAFVVMQQGYAIPAERDVIEHVKSRIASYKKPKSVEFVDSLALSPVGKVLRRSLREKFWEGRERNV